MPGVRQHSRGAQVYTPSGVLSVTVSHFMGAPLALLGCWRIHHRVFTITAYTSAGCFCALSKTSLNITKYGST